MFKVLVQGSSFKALSLKCINFCLALHNSLMSEASSNSQEKAVGNFTLNKEGVMPLHSHQG